ncbi:alpha/beta fold hydrolase [Intrasporangium sp.]|uniref:alpha/beta hydrolase n=1 Tax=Intrasporangium sp. TaxID=1925024 RepID=UPI003221B090
MREIPIHFAVGADRLAGALLRPEGDGPFPAALLVPGSGPVDRDSNHRRMRLDVTRELAHALADAGVLSLRYDKRGVGESRAAGDWRRFGVHDRFDEAAEALGFLRTRPEVDQAAVFVLGHSEGALAAAALGAADQSLAGVVLLSASATVGSELLLWQSRQIAPSLPGPVRLLLRLMRTDLTTKVARNHERLRSTTTDIARVAGVRTNARWAREFLDLDPCENLARITSPVLAITGTKDLQVDHHDLDRIADVVRGPAQTWAAPDLTHLLRRQPGEPSLRAYRSELARPVDEELLTRLTDWVLGHSRTAGRARGQGPAGAHPAHATDAGAGSSGSSVHDHDRAEGLVDDGVADGPQQQTGEPTSAA